MSARDFYGRWARLYDLVARAPGIDGLRARAADALALSPGGTVVEVGCGTGANFPHLRERVGPEGRIVGLDLTPGMLARARDGHLVRGDAARPPVAGEVDAVLASFVVGMLDDPAAAVEAWCDRLAPGGRVVLLDATRSDRPAGRVLAPAFRAFVTLTSPPGTRVRYPESPAAVLARRIEAARDALSREGQVTCDERHALGFVRLTAARVE